MSFNIAQIAETFCNWIFAEVFPYMADEIKWTAVGKEVFIGREAVIERCHQSTKFLETVAPTSPNLKFYQAGNIVFVEGTAQFRNRENQTLSVASCDIFHFSEGQLVEITSYVIELV